MTASKFYALVDQDFVFYFSIDFYGLCSVCYCVAFVVVVHTQEDSLCFTNFSSTSLYRIREEKVGFENSRRVIELKWTKRKVVTEKNKSGK